MIKCPDRLIDLCPYTLHQAHPSPDEGLKDILREGEIFMIAASMAALGPASVEKPNRVLRRSIFSFRTNPQLI
jgi:hypothetical protein